MNDRIGECHICESLVATTSGDTRTIWQDEHWLLRHAAAPYGVAGWTTLYTKRHVAGISYFNDAEAESFGPTLRRLELALEQVTGALRVYTAAMGESSPHFHGHLVPRMAETPGNASAWGVFDLGRRARLGEVWVDPDLVHRIIDELQVRLAQTKANESPCNDNDNDIAV
jgi:diadenosine tetraphosphate (Ap4A) HIT family hydrolase